MLILSAILKSMVSIKNLRFYFIFCYDNCLGPNNSVFKVNSHKKQNFNTSPSQVQVCWGRSECFGCLTLSEAHTRPPTARPYICHFSPQMYFWAQFFSIWKRVKGWLAIAKLKPLSLFSSLFQHFQMLFKSSLMEKWKVKVVLAYQWLASPYGKKFTKKQLE